jgi:two-component system phosphate regulon sensor histidine kinase PhoR
MSHSLSVEHWRVTGAIAAILVIGLLTQYWILAVILPSAAYIGWNLYQFHRLERWLIGGVKTSESPDGGGIWALVVRYLFRREHTEKKRKKHYKDVLQRLNSVISVLPDAAVVLNKNMEIEWSNSKAEELLGIIKTRDVGQAIRNLIRDPEFSRYLDDAKKNEDIECVSPQNSSRNIALRFTPFGKKQLLLTARDISEQVALRRMRKAFIANASHELRTPLTVISGYLEIMEAAQELPGSLRGPVEGARTQAIRMEGILEDLLALSGHDGTNLLEKDGNKIDVSALLARVTNDIRQTIAAGSHTIRLDADKDLYLKGVEAEIEGVCLNLVRNAVRHTPKGTEVDVIWHCNQEGQACLTVSDNGQGIPAIHLAHLTERFYRVDVGRSRESGGTGLGLSIVKHIVERHGGMLYISSEEGQGAKFTACFSKKHYYT